MRIIKDFWREQLQSVVLYRAENTDRFEDTEVEIVGEIECIVSSGTRNARNPEQGREFTPGRLNLFTSLDNLPKVEQVSVGDMFEYDDVLYEIKRVDKRTGRPTDYPIKIEGESA